MKIVGTRKAHQNQAAIDPWTVVHLSTGLAMGLMNIPLRWAVGASVAYEAAEQVFERYEWGQELFQTSGPESVSNAVMDTVVFAAGHWLGQRWNATADEPLWVRVQDRLRER